MSGLNTRSGNASALNSPFWESWKLPFLGIVNQHKLNQRFTLGLVFREFVYNYSIPVIPYYSFSERIDINQLVHSNLGNVISILNSKKSNLRHHCTSLELEIVYRATSAFYLFILAMIFWRCPWKPYAHNYIRLGWNAKKYFRWQK